MKATTKSLYEITAMADDAFIAKHPNHHTSLGLMDKVLRAKGIPADAVTVDNSDSKIRVVLLILDHQPELVGIGIGSTLVDDIRLLSELNLNDLTVNDVLALLEEHLISN
tara:strand:+ start:234 stop:563 length:330 start_codon:yes stop_codon:yes gene_type:complete